VELKAKTVRNLAYCQWVKCSPSVGAVFVGVGASLEIDGIVLPIRGGA